MSLQYQSEETGEAVDSALIPAPILTYILVAATVAVAAFQILTGLEPSIIAAGFDKPAFTENREYWRILTGATVHAGPLHVAMNCYALFSFGRILEMLSNRAHLAIVFLLAALGGGFSSLIFVPDGLSVGASGGVVGILGYLAVYAFRRRRFIDRGFRKSLLINIGFILVFGLVLNQVIDNYAHIGGLLTGAIYGLIQIPLDEYVDPRVASQPFQLLGFGAAAIYLGSCLFSILLFFGYV
ncbi:MAG: rhomboid family intramembrane serine protease [Pyrinomonadaceae bacterium]